MTASLKWRSCSRAISRTMSTIQASPASDPDVPAEPTISGIPALMARVIMISVSRLTAAAENMQVPVASGPGPGSVLPASQPIIRVPSEIALSSDSARNPEPSMPVAETSGNDAIAWSSIAVASGGYRRLHSPESQGIVSVSHPRISNRGQSKGGIAQGTDRLPGSFPSRARPLARQADRQAWS